jgi:CxxC-x17-CxxC domain-containing protein
MSFQDKTLRCCDFTFSVEDQEFFQSKGYTNEPKRCPDCRQARKAERFSGSSFGTTRQMFPVICAECGKETEVPFQPRGDRPVYCSDCFRKVRPNR